MIVKTTVFCTTLFILISSLAVQAVNENTKPKSPFSFDLNEEPPLEEQPLPQAQQASGNVESSTIVSKGTKLVHDEDDCAMHTRDCVHWKSLSLAERRKYDRRLFKQKHVGFFSKSYPKMI